MTGADAVQRIIDRQEIADLLTRYARAVDRCDLPLLLGIWAPGATVDYGGGVADADAWSAEVLGRLATMNRTMHALSNMLIAIEGDGATAETCCTAYHQFDAAGGPRRMIVGGRYLDRLARTGDHGWRVVTRRYVMDWNENDPSTAMWGEGPYARLSRIGGRFPDDPSYAA
ncbi:nuclear transport factor 2 family protein [Sphingomonas profundi]|uniref:nuclear transport factor 2 family protein n=1 Tax=Alterirhizorhabdus profundi TaxID=2681549 RepID=UPI0012E84DE0|nr:nuclear transport factor 2 family protein [Sphingomonas profundi]